MKRFTRLLGIAMAGLLALSPATAFAESTPDVTVSDVVATPIAEDSAQVEAIELPAPTLGVQVNGDMLDFSDASPVIENNRVFVPFRAVFESLGASEIAYVADSQTISATKGDTTVTFTIGDPEITITDAAGTRTETTDAASFVENDRTYVPVRFAAQALGCTVGWDANTTTAILIDKEALIPADITFETMGRLAEFEKQYTETNQAITGTMTMSATDSMGQTPKEVFKGTMTLNGITSISKVQMNADTKLDLSSLKADMTEEDLAVMGETIAALESFDMTFLADMESGKMYFASPLLTTFADLEENTYLELDFKELMGSMGIDWTSLIQVAKDYDYAAMIDSLVENIPTDSAFGAATSIETIEMMVGLYGDQAFTKTDDGYTATFTSETDGLTTASTIRVLGDDKAITGYEMNVTSSVDNEPMMTMDLKQDGADITMNMDMEMLGFGSFTMDCTMNYAPSDKAPQVTPPSGAKVVTFEELLGL